MTIDIQKLALYRLVTSEDTSLFTKLSNKYFTEVNLLIFKRIEKFNTQNLRICSADELYQLLGPDFKTYVTREIFNLENQHAKIDNQFIVDQLETYFIKEETIAWLDRFIDQLDILDKEEVLENIQQYLLDVQHHIPQNEDLFDAATYETFSTDDDFVLYSSGISNAYDAINGGFALQELVMIGGRRGSGKSIISLNCAKHQFINNDNSVIFMSIEMRQKEVFYRLMSMLSQVPFLKMFKNELTDEDKIKIAHTKLDCFYKSDKQTEAIKTMLRDGSLAVSQFDKFLKDNRPEFKDKRFLLVDDANLSLPKIDNYLNQMTQKHKIKLCVIDYLNIIKVEDRMDWKSQIAIADTLKNFARKYNITILSPYQIDESGEARFAKGVLDSADRSFRFTPADFNDNPNILPFDITKIRNGKSMKFDVHIDWECVRLLPDQGYASGGKILNKYGHDSSEQGQDL